jgi:hypothetical protein
MRKPHFNAAKSASFRSQAKPAPVATLGASQSLARTTSPAAAPRSAGTNAAPAKTSTAKPRRRRLFFAGSLSLLTAAAGAVGYFEVWPKYVCRQWEAKAISGPDAEAIIAVARLEGCGTLGTIALTRLLASDRAGVAEAAYENLSATCRRIRDLAGNDGDDFMIDPADMKTLEALATGLEELAEKHKLETPPKAADFAWDVLEMTGRMKLHERVPMMARGRLTIVSDQLLQRPTKARAQVAKEAQPKTDAKSPPADAATLQRLEAQRTLASLYTLPQPATAPNSATPPAGLPTAMPALPLASVGPAPATSEGLPSGIGSTTSGSSSDIAAQSTPNAAARINPIRQVSTAPGGAEFDAPANPTYPGPSQANSAAGSAALQRHLTTRTAWALLGDLQAAGTPQASAAAAELHRRGFSLREIELGKQLTSPDAAERAKHLATLPSAGIAVKPWLLYLSGDPDAEVRRAAVAIMATSNDPELRAKLREMAIGDGDEIVREQAAKSGRPTTMRAPVGYQQ